MGLMSSSVPLADGRPRSKSRFALGLPDARGLPWNERVVKVRAKVFVFLGRRRRRGAPALPVRLVESHDHALSSDGARPTGYGLGRTAGHGARGRRSLGTAGTGSRSYRIVAPKRLVADLDAGSADRRQRF